MQERLAEATQLREAGRARQDQALLEEARQRLLELSAAYPENAEIAYQAAMVHDNLGHGREAVPFYIQALEHGLVGQDTATGLMQRERAFLGLGSTYRTLGEYQQSEAALRRGLTEFPESRPLQIFLALTLYNTEHYKEAMELVLHNLLETTSDTRLLYFKRGLEYYASHLDETW